ncbi:MAG: hypothetical protein Q8M81_12550 [Sediminibacterium sp.]|nr:hypothetical protein [Sediminibacterium sp.]
MFWKCILFVFCSGLFVAAKPGPKTLLKKKLPVFFQPASGGDIAEQVAAKLETIILIAGFTKIGDEQYASMMEEGKQQVLDFVRDPGNLQLKPGESIEKKTARAFGSVSAKAQSIQVIIQQDGNQVLDSIGFLYKLIPPLSNHSRPVRLLFPIEQTGWNHDVDSLTRWLSKKLL